MTITQTVEIPANRRLTIEVPREVPLGKTVLVFKPEAVKKTCKTKNNHRMPTTNRLAGINEARQLLQKEMTQNGTAAVPMASGDGWESHVRERYAKS